MNFGRECSFWDLYSKAGIRIPQIQRDYVQGRNSLRVETNRVNFVEELVSALTGKGKTMMLNFIYGYYEDERFVPIDGQQRLTTLFLLHFYVFSKAGREDLRIRCDRLNFSYETRYTTDRFFRALYEHSDICNSANIRDAILDSSWYAFSWNYDPSIESSVIMLREIQKAFEKEEGNHDWGKYSDTLQGKNGDCPIKFMLLELGRDQLGKPNQLYIRMNSRGKQLTDFENFKASLYEYADESDNKELKEWKGKISNYLDGDWQDLIWQLPGNNDTAEKYSDVFYREVIHWIFVNRLCSESRIKDEDKEWITPSGKSIADIVLKNYLDIACDKNNIIACVKDIFYTFDVLNKIRSYKVFDTIKNEVLMYKEDKRIYQSVISEYKSRIILFAITRFGQKVQECEFSEESFFNWFRIIRNLTNNTEIDDAITFCRICKSIGEFKLPAAIGSDISSIESLDGFAKRQIKEEKFKQKIINYRPEWKKIIYKAEKNDYFQGEILFSFYLGDIYSVEDAGTEKLKAYEELWEKIETTMEFANEHDNLFHRALLTCGDYSKKAPGWMGDNGVVTFFRYKEKHHNYDWRGFLRPVEKEAKEEWEKWMERLKIFKSFLERIKIEDIKENETKDMEDIAEEMISEYCNSESSRKNEWEELLYSLVQHEELFEYCRNYYYIWHDKKSEVEEEYDRYVLMKNSKRNTYVEVNVKVLSLLLKCDELRNGGNPYNSEDRRSYLKIGQYHVEYKKRCFVNASGEPYKDSDGKDISSVDEMKKYLDSVSVR